MRLEVMHNIYYIVIILLKYFVHRYTVSVHINIHIDSLMHCVGKSCMHVYNNNII